MNTASTMRSATRATLMTPDWITVRGSTTTPTIQAPEMWVDMSRHADAIFYLEVAEVTAPASAGPGLLLIQLETSPTADESLFAVVAGPIVVTTTTTTPILMKTTGAGSIPLARFLRWKVVPTATGSWDVTFRLRAVCNRQSYFAPTTLGGCQLWLRADRAVGFTAGSVATWGDQSGMHDTNKNLTAGGTVITATTMDANYNNQQTLAFTGAATSYMTSGIWASNLPTPCTWVLVGHRPSSANDNYFIDGNGAAAANNQSIFGTPPALGVNINLNAGAALTFANPWTSIPSAALFEINGASSNIFYNNFTTASASGNAGSNTLTSLSVGSKNPTIGGGGANTWLGTMAEIIGFSKVLTSAQKGYLRTYLNNRYALAIT